MERPDISTVINSLPLMPVVLIFVSLLRNQECSHKADEEIDEDIEQLKCLPGSAIEIRDAPKPKNRQLNQKV